MFLKNPKWNDSFVVFQSVTPCIIWEQFRCFVVEEFSCLQKCSVISLNNVFYSKTVQQFIFEQFTLKNAMVFESLQWYSTEVDL